MNSVKDHIRGGIRKCIARMKHIKLFVVSLYGSWEALVAYEMLPRGVGAISTSANPVMRTCSFMCCSSHFHIWCGLYRFYAFRYALWFAFDTFDLICTVIQDVFNILECIRWMFWHVLGTVHFRSIERFAPESLPTDSGIQSGYMVVVRLGVPGGTLNMNRENIWGGHSEHI